MSILEDTGRKVVTAVAVAVLAAALSCEPGTPRRVPSPRKAPAAADSLTVFFTGSSLGRLKPCGCSGGQLGGLERRPAVFNTVPVEKRMLVDTGTLVETNGDQDLIKLDIIVEALSLLDYDVVNLTRGDLELVRNRGLLGHPALKFISPHGTGDEAAVGYQNRYLLDGEYVTISVLTLDVDTLPLEQIKRGFVAPEQDDKTVNILIVSRCDEDIISSIAALRLVDCIVCPSEAEEPMIHGSPNRRPLVVSVGRYGRHICSLKIEKARVGDRLKFRFTWIPVKENLKPDATLKALYKNYQQRLRDSNLLAEHPRYPLDRGLKYVGSEACKVCHEPAYEKWLKTGHAKAYATLEEVGSQYDPECVLCHVVGLDYESGFVAEQETPGLKNVDCESCHGPGSEHLKSPDAVYAASPKSTCIDCHTPEHSGEYAGNERAFRQKIIHWTEPNAPGNVK